MSGTDLSGSGTKAVATAGADRGEGWLTGDDAALREQVRRRYAELARKAGASQGCGCGCGSAGAEDAISRDLYASGETAGLPGTAVEASLGCGNPTALAELRAGEVVLDLGSGAGLDVLLSARRVGPTGKAYGLDMTDEMLALAQRNQAEAGIVNAEFLRGHLEDVPLPAKSVDVVISNCVVNLSPDKDRVLAEAFRVLRPGGRLAIADVVVEGEVPAKLRRIVELWSGCLAGALTVEDYRQKLAAAGFADAGVEITRVYDAAMLPEAAQQLLRELGVDLDAVGGRFASAFVRATKPHGDALA
jgi:SAM-dependent methyltransferase